MSDAEKAADKYLADHTCADDRRREAFLAGYAAAMQWRPIESAPRDGREAFVYRPLAEKSGDKPIAIKRLIGGNNSCWPCTVPDGEEPNNPTEGSCHVTHWMPLPLPPSE